MDDKIYNLLLEIKEDINFLKKEISNLKLTQDDENNLELIFLEDGFKLDSELIKNCLSNNNINSDVELLNQYYNKSTLNKPIKKEKDKIYYYQEKKWHIDEDNHICNTIINNLINSYIVYMRKTDQSNFLESKWETNVTYITKLQSSKIYKNKIFKQFLNSIYND